MAESKSKKTESSKKIIDVKRSGDAASGTSRPVIVTNRPILKDPMMAEVSQLTGGAIDDAPAATPASNGSVDPASGAPEMTDTDKPAITTTEEEPAPSVEPAPQPTPVALSAKKKIVIKPLSETSAPKPTKAAKKEPTVADLTKPDVAEIPDSTDDTAQTSEPEAAPAAVSEPAEAAEPTAEPAPEVPEEAAETAVASGGIQPGRSFDEAETATKDEDPIEPEEVELDSKGKPKTKLKKAGELTPDQQKAVEAGTYFLPITTAETRRLHREIVLSTFVIVVLIIVWLDVMLDADLLSLGGVKAITHFF